MSDVLDKLGITFGKPLSRRALRDIERQERDWHAKVRALMDGGLSFDEAWVAAGGQIINDADLALALPACNQRSSV